MSFESLGPLWAFFTQHAHLMVFAVTAIDATGTPFPGRVLLIGAGALAAAGEVSVLAMIALAAVGAVVGDHAWYVAGRWHGQRVLAFFCRITARAEGCVDRANALLRRFGALAIVIGRFAAGLRIVVTAVAASSGMPYYQYLLAEVVGALVWASLFVLIGYGAAGSLRAFLG
jgi:membrane protein DedA with SNARE-associated domain